MRIAVALDARFYRTPDGKIWGLRGYDFWGVYLRYFEQLKVVARVQNVTQKKEGWKRSCGSCVEFADVPHFVGVTQYVSRYRAIYRAIEAAISPSDAVISRSGNTLDGILFSVLRKRKQAYGVQLVNSPYELFKKNAYHSLFRPLLNIYFPYRVKKICRHASCLTSVSKTVLQQFRPNSDIFCDYFSDVTIPEETLHRDPRRYKSIPNPLKILFVGSLALLHKAPDLLIRAVAKCRAEGLNLKLRMVGDGQKRGDLERLAKELAINDDVTFIGHLPGPEAVKDEIESADLFILPSHTEGLPRAIIEAMACGLPCIGTSVGGIPELLDSEDLVPSGNVNALAKKIQEVIAIPERLTLMSERNLQKARREYRGDVLRKKEEDFYTELKRVTQDSLTTK
ncbi:MAG: glycosyltransferase [Planctomycetia bacterium]|jgi:glycosyltransferase involved in cell wall biosynthesis